MATQADLKDIKVGGWEVYIGATRIGLLKDDDFKVKADGNLIAAKAMLTGAAAIAYFSGGTNVTVSFKVTTEHKPILQRIYNWLGGSALNPAAGSNGSIEFNSTVGVPVKDAILTAYCIHTDSDGNIFGADSSNPISVQLYRAINKESVEWVFSPKDTSMHDLTFDGLPNLDKPNNSAGKFGFVSLPGAGVVYTVVTTPGTGYTTVPTVTIGTQFAATTAYTLNQQVAYLGNLYTVTTAGTSGAIATAPVHTSGAVASGTATFTYAGTAATAVATIASGAVTALVINTAGSGYTTTPTIAFTGGGGSGAAATATLG